MSRKDELRKQYPELNITLIDCLALVDTSGTYKYLPTIVKMAKAEMDRDLENISNTDIDMFELSETCQFLGLSVGDEKIRSVAANNLITMAFRNQDLTLIKRFMELNENRNIEQNDLTKYSTLKELELAVNMAEMKIQEKELATQVVNIYSDENWIILRPLSFQASAKYGSNTKWCTTFNDKKYFLRYFKEGTLIYIINKKTNYKVAAQKKVEEKQIHWWNAEDLEIQVQDALLDDELYGIIFAEIKKNKANSEFVTEKELKRIEIDCKGVEKGTIFGEDMMEGAQPAQPPMLRGGQEPPRIRAREESDRPIKLVDSKSAQRSAFEQAIRKVNEVAEEHRNDDDYKKAYYGDDLDTSGDELDTIDDELDERKIFDSSGGLRGDQKEIKKILNNMKLKDTSGSMLEKSSSQLPKINTGLSSCFIGTGTGTGTASFKG